METVYALVRNIVYSSQPKHLSTDIPIDTKIQVLLRYDLDAIGFKSENVILQDVKGAKIVPIDVTYRNKVIYVTPLEVLEQDAHYMLEIIGGDKGIQTITNQRLEESWFMEFYTGKDNEVKAPVITSPTNKTIVKDSVAFKWETQENIFYYHLQISESNTFNHLVWPPDADMNVFDGEATPDFEYENGKRYYARIKAVSLAKEESEWSETIQFYFQAEEVEEVEALNAEENDPAYYLESNCRVLDDGLAALQGAFEEDILEGTNLSVKGITIQHGAFNQRLDSIKEIHIEFNEQIDPNSITSKTIYLLGERN